MIQFENKMENDNETVYVKNILEMYLGSGGCRLEDNVLVKEDGIENFTFCPRTCQQIEKVMCCAQNSKLWF